MVFDGGFSSEPYAGTTCVLHVSPHMWSEQKPDPSVFNINSFINNFSLSKNNPEELYWAGYSDALKNSHSFAQLKKIKKQKNN